MSLLDLDEKQVAKLFKLFRELDFEEGEVEDVISELSDEALELLRKNQYILIGNDIELEDEKNVKKRGRGEFNSDLKEPLSKEKKQTIGDVIGFMSTDILINVVFPNFTLKELRFAVQFSKRLTKAGKDAADSSLKVIGDIVKGVGEKIETINGNCSRKENDLKKQLKTASDDDTDIIIVEIAKLKEQCKKDVTSAGNEPLIKLLKEVLKPEFKYIYAFAEKIEDLISLFGRNVEWLNGFVLATKFMTPSVLDELRLFGKARRFLGDLSWKFTDIASKSSFKLGNGTRIGFEDSPEDFIILASQMLYDKKTGDRIKSLTIKPTGQKTLPSTLKYIRNLQELEIENPGKTLVEIPKELVNLKKLTIKLAKTYKQELSIPSALTKVKELRISAPKIKPFKLRDLVNLAITTKSFDPAIIKDSVNIEQLIIVDAFNLKRESKLRIPGTLTKLKDVAIVDNKTLEFLSFSKKLALLNSITVDRNPSLKSVKISDRIRRIKEIGIIGPEILLITFPKKMDKLERLEIEAPQTDFKLPKKLPSMLKFIIEAKEFIIMPKMDKVLDIKTKGVDFIPFDIPKSIERFQVSGTTKLNELKFIGLKKLREVVLKDNFNLLDVEFSELPPRVEVSIDEDFINTITIGKTDVSRIDEFNVKNQPKNVFIDDFTRKTITEERPDFFLINMVTDNELSIDLGILIKKDPGRSPTDQDMSTFKKFRKDIKASFIDRYRRHLLENEQDNSEDFELFADLVAFYESLFGNIDDLKPFQIKIRKKIAEFNSRRLSIDVKFLSDIEVAMDDQFEQGGMLQMEVDKIIKDFTGSSSNELRDVIREVTGDDDFLADTDSE